MTSTLTTTGTSAHPFADLGPETVSTRRMLAAFPDAHAAWRPHDKSRSLAELATHVANLPGMGVAVLTTDGLDTATRRPGEPLTTSADLLGAMDKNAAALQSALEAATPASLAEPWSLRRGDFVMLSGPRAAILRTLVLSHLIHHRAQLSVYYRLLGVPVPGMYGPSADDGMPK